MHKYRRIVRREIHKKWKLHLQNVGGFFQIWILKYSVGASKQTKSYHVDINFRYVSILSSHYTVFFFHAFWPHFGTYLLPHKCYSLSHITLFHFTVLTVPGLELKLSPLFVVQLFYWFLCLIETFFPPEPISELDRVINTDKLQTMNDLIRGNDEGICLCMSYGPGAACREWCG